MPSEAARIAKLEKKAQKLEKELLKLRIQHAALKGDMAELKKCCKLVEKWIKLQVKWSDEVTDMLRMINWAALAAAFPGGGGTNPPQTPPSWPPA